MSRSPHIGKPLHAQRGAVAILFALFLPVLLGFAALAVDLARLNLIELELQNAADAAALAGAGVLGGEPCNWSAADSTALLLARSNAANGAQIEEANIQTGYWNLPDLSVGVRPVGAYGVPDAGDLPAVRVTVRLSSTQNSGSLKFFFAPVLGIAETDCQASAVAVLPDGARPVLVK